MSEDPTQEGIPVAEPVLSPSAQTIIGDSIKEGWEAFKGKAGLLIGMLLVTMLISMFGNGILHKLFSDSPILANLAGQAFSIFVLNIISAGLVFACLRHVRNESIVFGDLFLGFSHYLPLVVANILFIIIVGIGAVLLIVPGIILALGLMQYAFLVMDKHAGGVDSLTMSWAMMKGYK